MKKERKITAPDGCEIEKVEIVDGAAVFTFREKERKLPKSWEEFCEKNPRKETERYIDNDSEIDFADKGIRNSYYDRNLLPDSATAEAVLALCQLIQLRNAFNGDWVPDYSKEYTGEISVYTIHFEANEITVGGWRSYATTPLYFKSRELRDKFLRYFRPLIEKLKPLYGIKEGGEE